MAVRKVRGKWRVDFCFGNERCRRNSPDNSKMGAESYEVYLKQLVARHGTVTEALKSLEKKETKEVIPLFKDFVPRWMERYVRVNNRPKEQSQKQSTLNSHLVPLFGSMQLDEITAEQIERYKGLKKQQGLSPKTINNHLIILHKALATAKEWGVLGDIPRTSTMKTSRPPFRFLNEEEETALLVHAPNDALGAMIVLALRTGLRYSELSALTWQDMDMDRRLISVQRGIVEGHIDATKNHRIRHIRLTQDAWQALQNLPKGGKFIFNRDGKPLHYKVMLKRLHRLCKRTGIQPVSWHDLRHTFASRLVARGAPLLAVQQLLGHSDIKMTMRYSHLGPDILQNVVGLLEAEPVQRILAPGRHQLALNPSKED